MAKQNLSLLRQQNSAGIADKQGSMQTVFQLADCFADSRLADIQLTGSLGDIACPGYGVKNAVLGKILIHEKLLYSCECFIRYSKYTSKKEDLQTEKFP